MQYHRAFACAIALALSVPTPARSEGADVMLGELVGVRVYAQSNGRADSGHDLAQCRQSGAGMGAASVK